MTEDLFLKALEEKSAATFFFFFFRIIWEPEDNILA